MLTSTELSTEPPLVPYANPAGNPEKTVDQTVCGLRNKVISDCLAFAGGAATFHVIDVDALDCPPGWRIHFDLCATDINSNE